jgi:hypothetical protein
LSPPQVCWKSGGFISTILEPTVLISMFLWAEWILF